MLIDRRSVMVTTQNPIRVRERERAVQLISERWRNARHDYYNNHSEPLDERLQNSIDDAIETIRNGTDAPGEGDGIVLAERERASTIVGDAFFEAWDAIATDGLDEDYPESI